MGGDDTTDELRRAEEALQRERELTRVLLSSSFDGILAFDRECRYTWWSPGMERIAGLRAPDVLGRRAFEVFPFLVETGEDQAFLAAIAGQTTTTSNRPYTVPASGHQGFFEAVYSPVRDGSGEVVGGLAIIRDITARVHAEQERVALARAEAARARAEQEKQRLAFLAQASEMLSSTLDYDDSLRHLARMVVPMLGDQCIVDIVVEGAVRRVAVAHVVPAKLALLERLTREHPPDLTSPQPGPRAIRSGQPELLPVVDDTARATHTSSSAHAALIAALGVRSHLAVPLTVRGEVLGALSIGISESDRQYGPEDAALATELARLAAIAIDNARHYADAQRELAERRRTEEALRGSEERLRLALAAARMSEWAWDLTTDVVTASGTPRELWGVDVHAPADLLAHVHPDDAERVRERREAARSGEGSYAAQYRLQLGGLVRWAQDRGRVVRDDSGHPVRLIAVTWDVTELKQAEAALRRLADAGAAMSASLDHRRTMELLCQSLTPELADWCVVDLVNEEGQLERATVHHSDPSKRDGLADTLRAYPPEAASATARVMASGRTEWRAHVHDGALAALAKDAEHLRRLRAVGLTSYVCVPLQGRDRVLGALTASFAESGRRHRDADVGLIEELGRRAATALENALLYEKLRAEDRRKDEFLATLAHELRNPLAPLRNGLEVWKMAPDSPAAGRVRSIMERQLAHMVRLIDDLLDVSRVTRGKVDLQRERLDLQTIVATAVEANRSTLQAARLDLQLRLPSEPLLLDADRTRLAQVLSNLLNNAAKYTEPGGTVTLAAARDGADILITVADTGVGIPRDMLGTIFELFAQVGRSLERSQGGLGLGLTLARHLVELHGGRVWAESDGPGTGSRFFVRLPAAVAATTAAATQVPRGTLPISPRRVLVVDDNRDAAETLADLLRLDGHDVATAPDGPSALALAPQFGPDLAFLDIGMPGMNGYELAAKFRADMSLAPVRLVALTGWGQERDRMRAQAAGFDHHLTKPVDPDAVRAVLGDGE